MRGLKAFSVGIVLGLAFVVLVHTVPPQPARQLIALFLALTAGTYVCALLAQELFLGFIVLEFAMACAVFGLAVVGLRASTIWLAAGYTLHGAWDLLHHPKAVPTRVVWWFPPTCAAFDFVVALALVIGPWRPLS
jgi:uncharacterized protein DUF6010